jgi:2-iminobutanoate/2-iminopropanoate deaminase
MSRRWFSLHSSLLAAALTTLAGAAVAQISPNGVKTLSPPGAIKPTGTWDLGARAGDFIYVAGMRGIDPQTNTLVQGDEARIRQAFLNMKLIAESEGATLRDCVRIVVYTTDMYRFRPIANKVQEELWGKGPYPRVPSWKSIASIRTTFWKLRGPSSLLSENDCLAQSRRCSNEVHEQPSTRRSTSWSWQNKSFTAHPRVRPDLVPA